jgi:hypothetical protein
MELLDFLRDYIPYKLGLAVVSMLAGIIVQPTPLRRTEIDPLNRGKLMMLTKEFRPSDFSTDKLYKKPKLSNL